jgi:hypothetical protein
MERVVTAKPRLLKFRETDPLPIVQERETSRRKVTSVTRYSPVVNTVKKSVQLLTERCCVSVLSSAEEIVHSRTVHKWAELETTGNSVVL